MKNNKFLLSIVGVLVLALTASIIYSVDEYKKATALEKKETALKNAPHYLWSQAADSGSLIGPDDLHLTLTLAGADVYTTQFTDRPNRVAYVVTNVDYERRWGSYFATSAPNAVLAYQTAPGQRPLNIVLTLNSAKWNAESNTWTFDAVRIRKVKDNLPDRTKTIFLPGIDNPKEFVGASLFIDPASAEDLLRSAYCAINLTDRTCIPRVSPINGPPTKTPTPTPEPSKGKGKSQS